MWQISWSTAALMPLAASALALSLMGKSALAQDILLQQNQNGFDLPGVALPQGQDEVRAADGTSCASSIAGNGAYLDFGVIRGQPGREAKSNLATYGRLVVPLSKGASRLDCSKLYELEVQRLKLELELLRMGVTGGPSLDAVTTSSVETVAPASASASAAIPATVLSQTAAPVVAVPERKYRYFEINKKKAAWLSNDWSAQGIEGGR